MKIDNIDNISNKEKSPDKAERSASIEELKKTQKFFDFNDLSNAATINDGRLTIQESPPHFDSSSKLKKLLLNNDPEVGNYINSSSHEKVHNNSEYLNNINNNHHHDASSSGPLVHSTSLNNNSSISSSNKAVVVSSSGSLVKSRSESSAFAALNTTGKPITDEKNNSSVKKLFWCCECKTHFLQQNLFDHMRAVHNKFTCLYCFGFFLKIDTLERHLVRKHQVQNQLFSDEQALGNYLNVGDKREEDASRVLKAACCKCSNIMQITGLLTHTCGGSARKTASTAKEKIQGVDRHNIHVGPAVQQNDLNLGHNDNSASSLSSKQIDTTKEDAYCEKAIQHWLQPNAKTTFNGASTVSNETSSQNPVPHHTEEEDTSWPVEEQQQQKLVVPKLTLKIPKEFQNQQFDEIESDEDSGEEDDEEEPETEENTGSDDENEQSGQNLSNANNNNHYSSSSLSDTENEESSTKKEDVPAAEKRPENMPSLKLTIKNLTSTPVVLESFKYSSSSSSSMPTVPAADGAETTAANRDQTDVDMTECPMDLEPNATTDFETTQNSMLQEEPEPDVEPEPKKIIVDGVVIKPAHEDILPLELRLDEGLDKIPILKLMKICLRESFPICLYCNHARKIVVNGKGLAMHLIAQHRYHALVDSITAEELHPEKFNEKFEQCMDELALCKFNLDTFDDHDEEKKEGHVTISHDKLYECFQCRFQTPIHKELYLHNRKMHQKLLINCLMCKMSFHSYSELLCHICPGVPNKLAFKDYTFYCCLCNMDNIKSSFRLMVHLRKQHYACDVCLEKCSDQSKLSSHVWKHKLLHICYRCNIYYQNKADIMKHLFWKHGTEGVECKKCLQKKWPHVYHFCIPPPAFTCTVCEMQFTRAMALKVHLRLHEDGAKYACTEIECEKKFISKKLLIRHLERHQSELAAQQQGDQERTEGTVIIPAEIPNGSCTRTIPVVFKRFVKKPAVRKHESEPKPEQTKEEPEPAAEKKEEKKTKSLLDLLPETKLNLSESDSSSGEDEDDRKCEKKEVSLEAPVKQQPPSVHANEQKVEKPVVSMLTKVSTLSDSDEDDDETTPSDPKNVVEKQAGDPEQEVKEETKDAIKDEILAEIESKVDDNDEYDENKLPERKEPLHVCVSDHDYAKLYRPAAGTTEDDLEDMISSATIDKDKNKKAENKDDKSKSKAAGQSKKKSSKNDDFSSSDSSSGSSSSSSSGSSSGSSSSSSGSSSDSSSSEASSALVGATNKPRNKKFTKKRSKKDKKVESEEEEEAPRDPDDIIYESDLQTDETDTDEDFYDEHPLQVNNEALTEKRKQLGNVDGIIENSRPSTPSLPPDEKLETRLRIKKRKREHKKTASPSKRSRLDSNVIVNPDDDSMNHFNSRSLLSNPPETPQKLVLNFKQSSHGFIHTSTPISSAAPRMELHQANQIRQLLQSTTQQPILPILLEQQQQQHSLPQTPYQNQTLSNFDYINVSHVSSAHSSRMNSDNEQSGLKRSQRRRVPNKFYGYTSGDESMAAQLQNPNDPFKPIPPPVLTWDKEDLPSKSPTQLSSSSSSQAIPQRVAPLKLNINGEHSSQQLAPPEIYENYDSQQHTKQLPNNNHLSMKKESVVQLNHHEQSDSGSSDNDQLHISEPGKRKRKRPSQNMYAFHTLETPATTVVPVKAPLPDQPPIPKLKLTIGSNNKIRRRNINPLKPPAKKRKVAPKSNNTSLNSSAMDTSLVASPYSKPSQGPSSRVSTSEKKVSADGRAHKQVQAKDKQQKLEEAILNTQQYFQRYNHTQVANDIPQETVDNDGRVYCYCRRPYDDLQGMIGCDGPSCQIEWFHFECVGILVPPKGNWFCPQCQKEQLSG